MINLGDRTQTKKMYPLYILKVILYSLIILNHGVEFSMSQLCSRSFRFWMEFWLGSLCIYSCACCNLCDVLSLECDRATSFVLGEAGATCGCAVKAHCKDISRSPGAWWVLHWSCCWCVCVCVKAHLTLGHLMSIQVAGAGGINLR